MPRRAKDAVWQQELMGVAEIAIYFGVEKSTVTRWADEGLLPQPIDTLKLGRVWSYTAIVNLFATVNPEEHHLGDGEAREFGRRLRALKKLRELREKHEEALAGDESAQNGSS